MDTYEKKYKEALEIIKGNLDALNEITETGAEIVNIQSIRNCFYRAFPELKESEDERTRKALLDYFSECKKLDINPVHDAQTNTILAWLEKQGKQEPITEMKSPEESLGIDSETYNDIVNTCIFGENKPKFKVGDWIVNRLGNIWHIDSFDANNYQVTTTKGEHNYFPINIQDRMHLWTIADAKDNDVLAIDSWSDYPSSFVVIYKKQNGENFDSYCFVGFDGKFYKGENGHSTEEIHPATKEQRDLLFQKMYEAGYKWDGEKKELKKIEQKSATMSLDEAIEHCKEKSCGNNACALEHKQLEKWLTELKELKEQKPAWSEEDERNLNDAILFIETGTYSLDKDNLINWLKSLRPQWKPSDEQMKAVKRASNGSRAIAGNDYLIMESLYNDLKKLKGE